QPLGHASAIRNSQRPASIAAWSSVLFPINNCYVPLVIGQIPGLFRHPLSANLLGLVRQVLPTLRSEVVDPDREVIVAPQVLIAVGQTAYRAGVAPALVADPCMAALCGEQR